MKAIRVFRDTREDNAALSRVCTIVVMQLKGESNMTRLTSAA